MNTQQYYAIQENNKKRLIKAYGDIPNTSGIYFLFREEDGIKYAYVGQAKHILSRLAQHLSTYQHIDLSLRKHGFYDPFDNPTGYVCEWMEMSEDKLDEAERFFIKKYANLGYQMRNKTIGGQNAGKNGMGNQKEAKGYYDGLKQGYLNAQKYIAGLFKKNLVVSINGNDGVLKQRALQKFKDFINIADNKEEE